MVVLMRPELITDSVVMRPPVLGCGQRESYSLEVSSVSHPVWPRPDSDPCLTTCVAGGDSSGGRRSKGVVRLGRRGGVLPGGRGAGGAGQRERRTRLLQGHARGDWAPVHHRPDLSRLYVIIFSICVPVCGIRPTMRSEVDWPEWLTLCVSWWAEAVFPFGALRERTHPVCGVAGQGDTPQGAAAEGPRGGGALTN
jgi:hypothetical protein